MTTFTTQDRQDAQRTPLTNDECIDMLVKVCKPDVEGGSHKYLTAPEMAIEFARAIERAHGIE